MKEKKKQVAYQKRKARQKRVKKAAHNIHEAKTHGRPVVYEQGFNDLAFRFALLGASDIELAEALGTDEDTLNEWKKEHPSFSGSIRRGKGEADARVTEALYHRALGYTHESEEIKVVALGENQGSQVQRVPVVKHYPPDPQAIQFWLKNRQSTKWRDKQEIDHTNNGGSFGPPTIEVKPDNE